MESRDPLWNLGLSAWLCGKAGASCTAKHRLVGRWDLGSPASDSPSLGAHPSCSDICPPSVTNSCLEPVVCRHQHWRDLCWALLRRKEGGRLISQVPLGSLRGSGIFLWGQVLFEGRMFQYWVSFCDQQPMSGINSEKQARSQNEGTWNITFTLEDVLIYSHHKSLNHSRE